MFPSPCGDCISQIAKAYDMKKENETVSVPLRGLHFSNTFTDKMNVKHKKFPSPCGDCISQMSDFYDITGRVISFRPLAGTAFLKYEHEPGDPAHERWFPSPCGDCISQIRKEQKR